MKTYDISGIVNVSMYQSILAPEVALDTLDLSGMDDDTAEATEMEAWDNFDAEQYRKLVLERAVIELKKLLAELPNNWRCEYVEGSAEIHANYNQNILDRLYFKVEYNGVDVSEAFLQKQLTDFFLTDWNAEFGAQYRIYEYIASNYTPCSFPKDGA